MTRRRGVVASREWVSASAVMNSTVVMPAPTAASVSATSTASSSTNKLAATRLNRLLSMAATYRPRTRVIVSAMTSRTASSAMLATMNGNVAISAAPSAPREGRGRR